LSEGYDPFEVFRAVADHAANAARTYIDVVALEAFIRAIDECEDARVMAHSELLVDAFGIPDAIINAPIGLRDEGTVGASL
jgi:hypothetical protein